MPYPDPATLLRDWLRANVFTASGEDRVRVETEMPGNLQQAERLVIITVAPSSPGDEQVTLDVTDLIVDCYARTQDRANAVAEQIRAAIRVRMRHHTTPDGAFVKQVATFSRPARVPPSVSTRRQNSATYRLIIHAAP